MTLEFGVSYQTKPVSAFVFPEKPDEQKIIDLYNKMMANLSTPNNKVHSSPHTKSTEPPKATTQTPIPSQQKEKINKEGNQQKTKEVKKDVKKEEPTIHNLSRYEYLTESLKNLSLNENISVFLFNSQSRHRALVREVLDGKFETKKIDKILKTKEDKIITLFSTARHVKEIVKAIDKGKYVHYEILQEYPKLIERYKNKKAFKDKLPPELKFDFIIREVHSYKNFDDFLEYTNGWAKEKRLKNAIGNSVNAFRVWLYYRLKESGKLDEGELNQEILPIIEKYNCDKEKFWHECQRIRSQHKINARVKLGEYFN